MNIGAKVEIFDDKKLEYVKTNAGDRIVDRARTWYCPLRRSILIVC